MLNFIVQYFFHPLSTASNSNLCTASRRQLEKNGACYERKTNLQVHPEDRISIFDHVNIVPMTKRSNVNETTWQNAISNNRSLIVVEKNVPGPCTGAKFLQNTNDICHVIGMMYEKLLTDYNTDLTNEQCFRSISRLRTAAFHDGYIWTRFTNKLAVYGMEMWHISLLVTYKSSRNIQVHRPYWNIRPDVPRLEQRQNALALLNTANQNSRFAEAFQLCTSCVYDTQ
ncbi:uncharacterized protein OCT59_006754 [Rhizophagus irregularis]|uniref:uncharacterized protein n=1 Tax=Rhizophagus irregularis TaxID=588596 RepID=UPI0033245827|nr:hypothetical protein OCT59_006754 [Rhizophagus irregularis]